MPGLRDPATHYRHGLRIRPHRTILGSHFGPQLLMEVVAHKIPFVEIPVNYRSRVGESSVTGSFWKAFKLGLRMIGLVWEYRLGVIRRDRIPWTAQDGRAAAEHVQAAADISLGNLARAVGKPEATPETVRR